MIELITSWTVLITVIGGLLYALIYVLGLLDELIKRLPKWLARFLIYGLALLIPNAVIIWYFFYLVGLNANRLSEPTFFWAMVAQPIIGVSIYGYVWGKRIYPQVRGIVNKLKPEKIAEQEDDDQTQGNLSQKSQSREKSNRHLRERSKSSKGGSQ